MDLTFPLEFIATKDVSIKMAEREGFEPSIGVKAYTPLAGERLQPLGHLSEEGILYCK
jgi:hypothetical protein